METEVVDVKARKGLATLCGVLNAHPYFLEAEHTEHHRNIEQIRLDLGDDELEAHVARREVAEAERATEEEKARAVQRSKDNDIAALKAELEFLKHQMAAHDGKKDELADLRQMVEQLQKERAAAKEAAKAQP